MAKHLIGHIHNGAFYPGSIWSKRIVRLLVIFGIGANLFINDFQAYVLSEINEQSCEISAITQQIDTEKLRMAEISKESWTEWSVDWLAYFTDAPDSKQINGMIAFGDETLDRFDAINARLCEMEEGTAVAMYVLRYTSWFMWVPIAISLLWLLIDLVKAGEARYFTLLGLIVAIPFNWWLYHYLIEKVSMALGVA